MLTRSASYATQYATLYIVQRVHMALFLPCVTMGGTCLGRETLQLIVDSHKDLLLRIIS